MIELLDPHNRWVPAVVKKVDEAEVTAEFTNIPGESITQEWPAGSMRYLPTRLCMQADNFVLKVCFTGKESCPNGFMVDNGKTFADNGDFKYGWSRLM